MDRLEETLCGLCALIAIARLESEPRVTKPEFLEALRICRDDPRSAFERSQLGPVVRFPWHLPFLLDEALDSPAAPKWPR